MVSMAILVVLLLLYAGRIVWIRRHHGPAGSPLKPRQFHDFSALAQQAFTHGDSCLAAGQFAGALTAFHQARTLDPTHPHVADRLAEVERRQHAVSATPLVNATV